MAEAKPKTGAKPSKRVMDPKKLKKRQGDGEPTKDEYAVAKFVRFKCPTKKTTFGHGVNGEEVSYFVGSKAVDCLLESKWSSKKCSKKKQPLFTDRQSCVDYMQHLLMRGLFFRAKKLVPKIKEKPAADGDKKKNDQGKKGTESKDEMPKSPKVVKETEVKRRKKNKGEKEEEEKEKEKEEGDAAEKGKEKSSKSKKVRLDWHNEQLFIDAQSVYVWKYDPTPLKTWLLGLSIVLGAIGLCLFPLWPTQIRVGIYYVSSGALVLFGGFFGFILFRTILFGVIWAVTLGRHHLWLFPNLTEDCGVLESFKPVYSYKYVPGGTKEADDKDKKKKDKKSDSEDEVEGEGEEGGVDDEDTRESKDSQQGEGDRVSESESENENENDEEQGRDGESATASHDDNDDYDNKDDHSDSNEASVHTSTEEEEHTSKEQTVKKRRQIRRDDGQESSINGDFEIVDNPK